MDLMLFSFCQIISILFLSILQQTTLCILIKGNNATFLFMCLNSKFEMFLLLKVSTEHPSTM